MCFSWHCPDTTNILNSGLNYLVREPPFGVAHLADCDYTINFAEKTKEDDRVAVIATAPLTDDEDWYVLMSLFML